MRHHLAHLVDGYAWKIPLSILGAVITAIEGFYGTLIWLFWFAFCMDLLTGILKSHKNHVPITSKRLRDSVYKLAGYMILITTLIVLSRYQAEVVPLVTWTYYFFIFTEIKSIFENVKEMGVNLPKFLKTFADGKLAELDEGRGSKEDKGDEKDGGNTTK
ncbi:Holin family protein [compost metagenome]